MRVSVFGLGYVGTVTSACLARDGHQVVGVDVDRDKVAQVGRGTSPIVEPGLDELLLRVHADGNLQTTHHVTDAVNRSDIALVCVGTPSQDNGQLDLSAVRRVAEQIGKALKQKTTPFTAVLRSTVLPGTCEEVFVPRVLSAAGRDEARGIRFAVNPEFMREGVAITDFDKPPMTLVGTAQAGVEDVMRRLYASVQGEFIHTTIRNAEMVKYVCNAYHGLKVCFANEIADVCDAVGAEAQEVMRVFSKDRKLNISSAYLRPGFAFGGSCLPKDLRALVYAAYTKDLRPELLSSILPSNEMQIRRGLAKVLQTKSKRVGVVGLAFKPDTDDLREGPMVTLVEGLIGKGISVRILDRNVSLGRLTGANRRFIDQHLPHIGSLMVESVDELLDHSETIVVGNVTQEAAEVLRSLAPDQTVVDLTRSAVIGAGQTGGTNALRG